MKPLLVLAFAFFISLLVIKWYSKQWNYTYSGRIAMTAMLCFTATGHFVFTRGMTAMIPDFMPLKLTMVYLTGVLELLLAVGLLTPGYQKISGYVLIVFLALILPANINAAMSNINYQTGTADGPGLSYLWFRVPMQGALMLWAYWSAIRPFSHT